MCGSSLLNNDRPDVLFLKETTVAQPLRSWPQSVTKKCDIDAVSITSGQAVVPTSKQSMAEIERFQK
jgi:hypothetical protein